MFTIERYTDDPINEGSTKIGNELGRFTGLHNAKKECLNMSIHHGYWQVIDIETGEHIAGFVNGKQVN